MSGNVFRLLIRALDAGDSTYVSYRWLDDPQHPWVRRLTPSDTAEITDLLNEALIGDSVGDGSIEVRRALSGPLSTFDRELAMSSRLATLVLGERFWDTLDAHAASGDVTIEYTPSPTLSRVPLELMPDRHESRLIEKAELICVPPASLHAGRANKPSDWAAVANRRVLYIVDPNAPNNAGLLQILPPPDGKDGANTRLFQERIQKTECTPGSGIHRPIRRWMLHDELTSRPSRLFYFGHVSSTLSQPGSASLHLADEEQVWGLAARMNGSHRPLSALDLLYGTSGYRRGARGTIDARIGIQPGHKIWPMPPRVAIIACEGGSDYRSDEIFGLVTACMNSGAELVTTTRWTLPSDTSMAEFAGIDDVPGPTTELALAVDDAHRTSDPVAALNSWQRTQLAAWRETGRTSSRHSPLVWASVADHVCGWRPVERRAAG